ncbi:hypothetical protein ACHHYP_03262 [Achlya hypogyna]|uniref:RWP-RK domain-containing protein n=1 Tax=Achlya hypogyna TaxID=1202772 RepID=A0A1V9ZRK1_ACHHY|nr:hypothetical protein ACHHYP_03262 [Achlya hypogyna]
MEMMSRPMSMVSSPLSTGSLEDDEMRQAARLHAKKAMVASSPMCNFEAFSLYFHLPLKAAAEKFGVRATAFKKRCRAIGIRHWPYRKVRSLKRSLQELNRCKDNGILNDKQMYQYDTFKKQLDKLMAPETYGIDPSGQFLHPFHDDDDDGMDSGDDMYSVDSPRYGASFSDCSISPTDGDKAQTFLDYPATAFDKLPPIRKQPGIFHMQRINVPTEIPGLSLRMSAKDMMASSKGPPLDAYFLDTPEKPTQYDDADDEYMHPHHNTSYPSHNQPHHTLPDAALHHDDIMLTDIKYDDDDFDDGGHVDYGNERFFDDVFLQISPDYGCLV